MKKLPLLLALAVLGCTNVPTPSAQPSKPPPPKEETLHSRRADCTNIFDRAVNLSFEDELRLEDVTLTKKQRALALEDWRQRLLDNSWAPFLYICVGKATKAQVDCALVAKTTHDLDECINED